VRCRHCRDRFGLIETTWWTGPSGPPATPRQLLVLSTLLFSGAGAVFLFFLARGAPPGDSLPGSAAGVAAILLLSGAFFFCYWPCIYLDWLVDMALPRGEDRAGTCPACGHHNWIWPWSG